MAYEPSERVRTFIERMRAEPARTWDTAEAGEVMGVMRAQVPSYLDAAVRHRCIHRGMVHGRLMFGLEPFPASGPAADARAPQVDPSWSPQKMIATRPGSEQVARSAPAPVATPRPTPAPPPPTSAPAPAPTPVQPPPAPAPTETPAAVEEPEPDEGAEEVEGDAYISCRTGEIVLVGLEPDEDGRVTIPADLVQAIRRHTAWGPM